LTAPNIGLVAMPPEQYHADPCAVPSLSSTIAHALVAKSPAHAYLQHPRLGGKGLAPTAAMDEGSLMHELILRDDDELKARLVIVKADDWRTKVAREQRDEARAAGKLAVLSHEYDKARIACAHIFARLIDLGVKLNGASEIAAFWQESANDGTVVQCRGMSAARRPHRTERHRQDVFRASPRSGLPACQRRRHVRDRHRGAPRAALRREVQVPPRGVRCAVLAARLPRRDRALRQQGRDHDHRRQHVARARGPGRRARDAHGRAQADGRQGEA
jgi:hypothetical protein